jgi:hypothetical protein
MIQDNEYLGQDMENIELTKAFNRKEIHFDEYFLNPILIIRGILIFMLNF